MGVGYLYFEEDDEAGGIRNLREVWQVLWLKNAERYVIRVRRWSIVPRLIAGGIRNLREGWQGLWYINAERYVIRVRRWSIVPRFIAGGIRNLGEGW